MSDVLASVDSRTKLVGENRLELLIFQLSGSQAFAINVFKVQEVLRMPELTLIPHRNYNVCGITTIRGRTIPVINLSQAIGMPALEPTEDTSIIVTEYNRSVQAFLVSSVQRIVNMTWEEILPPPKGAGRSHYLTAITRFEDEIVEIIDVEKVLAEIAPIALDMDITNRDDVILEQVKDKFILVVDDSPVAINQCVRAIGDLGINTVIATNGLEAWEKLLYWQQNEPERLEKIMLVLTDAEMPKMDGYRLTTEIKAHPDMAHLYVVLHTSLSGSFNNAMVEKVGCDGFISKFEGSELGELVMDRVKEYVENS